jgi:hypothetical protein
MAGGKLNQLRAQLGNDIAIKAFKDGTRPFPNGAMIAALHWNEAPSEGNDKSWPKGFPAPGLQSAVVVSAVNVQFMVKDSKKYTAMGGWGSPTLRTASRAVRRCTKPASLVVSLRETAISFSRITRRHLELKIGAGNGNEVPNRAGLSNDGRGALNNVTVTTAPGYGFTGFTVDLIDPIHHTVDVTVITNTGTYSDSFTGQGGSNFVSVLASAGETISSINFSGTNGGWEQFKQPQIQMPKPEFAPDPIPEPSTWAMMLLGFAALGFAGYRASRKAASIAVARGQCVAV